MLRLGLDFILVISGNQIASMRRQDRRELLLLNLEPERTLHRLRRKTHATQSEIMQNQEDKGQFHDRNEP